MDRSVVYTMVVEIPFNSDTSSEWSENSELSEAFIDQGIDKIHRILESGASISLNRVMRIFGLKESALQPNIFFHRIEEIPAVTYDNSENAFIISMYLTGGYLQEPVRKSRREGFKPYIVKPEEEFARMDEPVMPLKENESEDAECQTGQKETSDSVENGKT